MFRSYKAYYKERKPMIVTCFADQLSDTVEKISSVTTNMAIVELKRRDDLKLFPQEVPVFSADDLSCILPCNRSEREETNERVLSDVYAIVLELFDSKDLDEYVVTHSLYRSIPSPYSVIDTYLNSRGELFFIYGKEKRTRKDNTIAIIIDDAGYGDSALLLPLLRGFVKTQHLAGNPVALLHMRERSYSIHSRFIPEAEHVRYQWFNLDNPLMGELLYNQFVEMGTYEKCYNFIYSNFTVSKHCHAYELAAQVLGYEGKDMNSLYSQGDYPDCTPFDSLSLLSSMKESGSALIGFQYFTDTDKHIQSRFQTTTKCWSPQKAQEFVDLCNNSGLTVINLSRTEVELQGVLDFSHLKVHEMFGIVKNLDAMVGIDSCFGHIAAVLGTKNITVWGCNYPDRFLDGNPDYDISYRPIRLNYSIADRNTDIENISASLVHQRLMDLLADQLAVKQEVITYQDTLNNVGVEWV